MSVILLAIKLGKLQHAVANCIAQLDGASPATYQQDKEITTVVCHLATALAESGFKTKQRKRKLR